MSPSAALLSEPRGAARPERAALARAVLARAEERTGTDSWARRTRLHPVEAEPEEQQVAPGRPDRGSAAGERTLPVAPHLTSLLPSAGLERGSTVVVAGSTSLTLALLAEVSRSGGWVALVGLPGLGVLAGHQLGLALERVVLVPAPGPDGPTVVAALLDGVDVVVVGPVALAHADRRRLSARARERGSVLMPTTPWPGAHVVLTAGPSRWEGLGQGYGRLRSRQLTVQRSGRGTAGRAVTLEVAFPGTVARPAGTGDGPSRPDTDLQGRRAG